MDDVSTFDPTQADMPSLSLASLLQSLPGILGTSGVNVPASAPPSDPSGLSALQSLLAPGQLPGLAPPAPNSYLSPANAAPIAPAPINIAAAPQSGMPSDAVGVTAGPLRAPIAPVSPSAPTPPQYEKPNLPTWAKVLLGVTALAGHGGASLATGIGQGMTQAAQQDFENAQKTYQDQVQAQSAQQAQATQQQETAASQQAQTIAQLKAHGELFDNMARLDPDQQEQYLKSLSDEQLGAYGVNKAAFYDASGKFVPVTKDDADKTQQATQKLQLAAQKQLGDLSPKSQQARHDALGKELFEKIYGQNYDTFVPTQTAKAVNDAGKLDNSVARTAAYTGYQQARETYMKALTSQDAQKIANAKTEWQQKFGLMTKQEQERVRHDEAGETLTGTGLGIRQEQIGINKQNADSNSQRADTASSALNLKAYTAVEKAQISKDPYLQGQIARANQQQKVIDSENAAKDALYKNPTVSSNPTYLQAATRAHDFNIQQAQSKLTALNIDIDRRMSARSSPTSAPYINPQGTPGSAARGAAVPPAGDGPLPALPIAGNAAVTVRPVPKYGPGLPPPSLPKDPYAGMPSAQLPGPPATNLRVPAKAGTDLVHANRPLTPAERSQLTMTQKFQRLDTIRKQLGLK